MRRRLAAAAAALAVIPLACGGGETSAPAPGGCITDVSRGAHTFTCEGLRTDAFVPESCRRPGCGIVLELHGDTGSGLLIDANTNLMALGARPRPVLFLLDRTDVPAPYACTTRIRDPYAVEDAVACAPANAFVWGEQVMAFFAAHPG
jgi:poly(3-hydroxybutyrate) depolymerase